VGRAGRRHLAAEPDRATRVVRPRARDDRDATGDLVDDDLDDPAVLLRGERRRLAGRPAGHDEVHALRELPAHERAQRALVDGAVRRERRDERGAAAAQRRARRKDGVMSGAPARAPAGPAGGASTSCMV
jgi:hypothetical protein